MTKTSIEWTDYSWNPIRARRKSDGKRGHYCQRISPGCKNCYAASMNRWRGNGVDYTVPGLEEVELYLDEKALLEPLRWRKPRNIFVCSMTDLYADFVPDEWIERIYAVMALADKHTFMVLTKRPARRLRWYSGIEEDGVFHEGFRGAMVEGQAQGIYSKLHPDEEDVNMWLAVHLPLENVWEGTSVCTQKEAEELIPITLQTPAALRWLSMEPLLEAITLEELPSVSGVGRYLNALSNAGVDPGADIPTKLDWVVCGGESGHGARPMHPDWARGLRDQCQAAGTPFFFKQWGEWEPFGLSKSVKTISPSQVGTFDADGASFFYGAGPNVKGGTQHMWRVGKKAAGALLDGREWREFPEVQPR